MKSTKTNKTKIIDNIKTLIINLLLWRVFLTFLDRDNRETVKQVSSKSHETYPTQISGKLNCLIKVEIYLLFEFPVGRVRGCRKFLNYEFFA